MAPYTDPEIGAALAAADALTLGEVLPFLGGVIILARRLVRGRWHSLFALACTPAALVVFGFAVAVAAFPHSPTHAPTANYAVGAIIGVVIYAALLGLGFSLERFAWIWRHEIVGNRRRRATERRLP